MKDIVSPISDNHLEYHIDTSRLPLPADLRLLSPKLKTENRPISIANQTLRVDLTGIAIYGLAQA